LVRSISRMNTRHEVLDWFGPSHGVIALCLVLLYYDVENYELLSPDALRVVTFIVKRTAL
jgi:hypothetical protein